MDPSTSLSAASFFADFGLVLFALLLVLLNGFFVAAEFAIVKLRQTRVEAIATERGWRGKVLARVHRHLDAYLSACQLGITIASLVLGALGEPAVSVLIVAAAGAVGISVADSSWLHVVALGLAFALITFLHMTVGEQAPKMWALRRAERTALRTALPLRAFAWLFGPFIVVINGISNMMLRMAGLPVGPHHESHTAEEIRSILSLAARSGDISDREYELTENVFRMIALEVRHIIVPRVDTEYLSLEKPPPESLRQIRETKHSRLPLCEVGLDSAVGIVHTKDALEQALDGNEIDLRALAREAIFVPDTMPLSSFLLDLQTKQAHCAIVLDERGTAIGLAFREDALEEIVGPLGDEFDAKEPELREIGGGSYELPGRMALPELCDRLDFELAEEENESEDTIGGHVTARLGRLPKTGDAVTVGPYVAKVIAVTNRRVHRLRFDPPRAEPVETPPGAEEQETRGSDPSSKP